MHPVLARPETGYSCYDHDRDHDPDPDPDRDPGPDRDPDPDNDHDRDRDHCSRIMTAFIFAISVVVSAIHKDQAKRHDL